MLNSMVIKTQTQTTIHKETFEGNGTVWIIYCK